MTGLMYKSCQRRLDREESKSIRLNGRTYFTSELSDISSIAFLRNPSIRRFYEEIDFAVLENKVKEFNPSARNPSSLVYG